MPLLLSPLVPSVAPVLLSRKVTVPVGVPLLAVTMAVNVTVWPGPAGLDEEISVVLVVATAARLKLPIAVPQLFVAALVANSLADQNVVPVEGSTLMPL